MRILILGGNGMLGHQFYQSWRSSHEVMVTLKGNADAYQQYKLFDASNSYYGITTEPVTGLTDVISSFRPDAVVNAIGVTKQRAGEDNVVPVLQTNAVFPHQLADICERQGCRLVHLSTDCVFSGSKGMYPEDAIADARDLYGRSKYLGEVARPHVVTLRKSTIGLELGDGHGLVEWFLKQTGTIKGYRGAIYSGLISSELANVIESILQQHTELCGVWNVASKPINKYDLLSRLAIKLEKADIEIIPDDDFICDRSLDGRRFENATGYKAPDWDDMLGDLALQIRARERNS